MENIPQARFGADAIPGSLDPQPLADPAGAEPAEHDIADAFAEADHAFAGPPDGEPAQPRESVTDSVTVYLSELDRAAHQALHYRRAARLAEEGAWLTPALPRHESRDGAIDFPPDVISRFHGSVLALARAHADELAAFTAAWYARAVVAASWAAFAGHRITGRELEEEVLDPAELPDLADDPPGPPWRPQYLPDLPDPAELTTRQSNPDQTVADIHRQLIMAYTAAQTVEVLHGTSEELDPGPEQQAVLDQAVQIADQIPDLLTWWASAAAIDLHHQAAPSE